MVRAVDKAFQHSIISAAIYHFYINMWQNVFLPELQLSVHH